MDLEKQLATRLMTPNPRRDPLLQHGQTFNDSWSRGRAAKKPKVRVSKSPNVQPQRNALIQPKQVPRKSESVGDTKMRLRGLIDRVVNESLNKNNVAQTKAITRHFDVCFKDY